MSKKVSNSKTNKTGKTTKSTTKNSKNKKNVKNVKKKKKHTGLRVFSSLIILIVLLVGSYVGYSTYKNGWGVKGLIQTAMGQSETKLKNLKPFTVLILGVSEDISSELTDTIIVASYNPKTQKATLLSIPRDTYIGTNKSKANSFDKINALYQKSPQKTLEAVNKLTGLNITYYLVVSNNVLVELVDEMGGIEFDVPTKMDYEDSSQKLYIHLQPGLQTLNGEQAEGLVRFRKNTNGTTYSEEYGDNDLGRMRTQREFLKAVAKQLIQLKNITKIGDFVEIFKNNIKTNITNWSLIKDYIPYALDFDVENIQMGTVPGDTPPRFGSPTKLSFFVPNEEETKALVEELFNNQDLVEGEEGNTTIENEATSSSETENENIKIELINGSGNSALLTKATSELKKEGYNVYKTGTTNTTSKTTIVNETSESSQYTEQIKQILGCGAISSSITTNSVIDIKIILGKDYY